MKQAQQQYKSFKKALLIDDDEINNLVFSKLAKSSMLAEQLIIFKDPNSAINYIKENKQLNSFDVFFIDINMPMINGWELIKEVREYINPNQTKVFMASSSNYYSDMEKAKKEPIVTDLIKKPIGIRKMIYLKSKYANP